MTIATTVDPTAFAVCTRCAGDLRHDGDALVCTACETPHEIRNGVPILLPLYDDALRTRYLAAYEEVARADLSVPFEYDRDTRHTTLLRFIGDVGGERVLDIGSSNGTYLRELDADVRVALDLALPFLEAIPPDAGIVPLCADAERLPVRPGYFDTIILSDVLEHLLEPERLMERLKRICRPDTRLIVHVPWKEDLLKYESSEYEFTHLRTFNEFSFATLWRYFETRRQRPTYPRLEEPIFFQLRPLLPLRVFNRILRAYFHGGLAQREYEHRERWIRELPHRERWLLKVYPPAFMMFELRLRPEHAADDAVRDVPLRRRRRR